MARWHRARQLLDLPAGARVLDLGCAFGFGTRLLEARYDTYGHDLSWEYIQRARRASNRSTFTCGPADDIQYPDAYFDGVLLLDVLEHVPDTESVIREIARILRPGGQLIVSVPNRGALAMLDSLNLYQKLLGSKAPAPTDDPSWKLQPHHKHYDRDQIQSICGPGFRIQSVHYSGLGLAEPVNLALLVLFRALLPTRRLYAIFQYLYFAVYLAEDVLETGEYGYHMMLCMEKL